MLHEAAAGRGEAEETFVRRYYPVVRAYLGARWRTEPMRNEVDDAAQEVFVECLRQGGALDRVAQLQRRDFRAFLFGLVRNVARMAERRQSRRREVDVPKGDAIERREADSGTLSAVFDRAWARAIIREALEHQRDMAADKGQESIERVELLRMRFYEGLPVREIAERRGVPAERLHREVSKGKAEFEAALRDVLSLHVGDGPRLQLEKQCEALLELLK